MKLSTGYRFEGWPSGSDLPGQCSTIDEAMAEAKRLSTQRGHAVAVMDRGEIPSLFRGIADGNTWKWSVPCAPCRSVGRVAHPSVKGKQVPCGDCQGKGRRVR